MKPITRAFHIAGVQFRDLTGFPTNLPASSPAKLVHDVSNPHDSFAVQVHLADYFIGYIPRQELAALHHAANKHIPIRCEVTYFPMNKVYEQFSARLFVPTSANVDVVKLEITPLTNTSL